MADIMTGKQLREYVESGGRVFLSPNYGGYYWLVEWTDKKGILQLAEHLEKEQERNESRGDPDNRDHSLAVEFVSESHLDDEPVDDEQELSDKSILTINMSFD